MILPSSNTITLSARDKLESLCDVNKVNLSFVISCSLLKISFSALGSRLEDTSSNIRTVFFLYSALAKASF